MKMGPIGGIFNLAVVLNDGILLNQGVESFRETLAPKVDTTHHFDQLTRTHCPDIEYFVAFSSIASGHGNAGQSNYALANALMERIIEKRKLDNLPAKAIQWGAIGDVGLAFEKFGRKNKQIMHGLQFQRIENCLSVMDKLITTDEPIVASMMVGDKHLEKSADLKSTVFKMLGVTKTKSTLMSATLNDLGMDSLATIEVQQYLQREYNILMSSDELKTFTVAQLHELSAKHSQETTDKEIVESAPVDNDTKIDAIESISMKLEHFGNEKRKNEIVFRVNDVIGDEMVLYIPGIEGMADNTSIQLIKKIKKPLAILQFYEARECKSISEVTSKYETV